MTDAPPKLVGRVLGGRYRVERLLGQGGMGEVYDGRQLDLDRRVAIKVLRDTDPAALERFRREAVAAGGLASPHVVAVFDFQAAPGEVPFLVMERLEGRTLGALLAAERKLEPTRAVRIASQMLVGLEAAHRAGIVHRDVKPSNVWLLTEPGLGEHVKLLDFGIAKLLGPGVTPLTSSQELVGTPAYLAPEQIRGTDLDARTDVHAVGVVLYEALSGALPYKKPKEGGGLLLEILRDVPRPLHEVDPSIPLGLSLVVARAMAKDPEARFARADEMRAALAPFAGSAGADVAPPTVPEIAHRAPGPAPAPAPRSRGAIFAAGIAGALVVGLLAVGIAVAVSRRPVAAPSAPEAAAPVASTTPLASEARVVPAAPFIPPAPTSTPMDAPTPPPAEAGERHIPSAKPVPKPPTPIPPLGQRPRCSCLFRRGAATLMVCPTPKTPSCACTLSTGTLACPVKYVDGKCATSTGPHLDSYGGPGRVSNTPCRGFDVGGVEGTGELHCSQCYGDAIVPGVEGEKCTGILRGTEKTVEGRFYCE